MEEHTVDEQVFQILNHTVALVSVVSEVLQNLKARVFLRKTAEPVLQSLKETLGEVRLVPLQEQIGLRI